MRQNTKERARSYRHLSIVEREEIAIGLEKGETLSSIAERLDRDISTVSREIKRNIPTQRKVRYRAHRAQIRYETRKQQSHKKERLKNASLRHYVEQKLKEDWTPELIAGRLPLEKPQFTTNYESIYQWIYTERPDLIEYLPRSHRKRRKRGSAKNKRSIRIPNRILIDERPAEVATRHEAGHWEADTVVSRQSVAAVSVIHERKSRYTRFKKLKTKSSTYMSKAVIRSLRKVPSKLRKSITYDNGTENAAHEATNSILNTRSYFCHPYHSWEKGSVENVIGLLRRYFPKKTNWSLITQQELNIIERKLNTRPKKCLGFRTPQEIFFALAS